jgi:copper chaperone CopZ
MTTSLLGLRLDVTSSAQLSLCVDGMTCGACVVAVDAALARLPGVHSAAVQLGSATVCYAPALLTEAQLLQGVLQETEWAPLYESV